jgi:hypothetical protein
MKSVIKDTIDKEQYANYKKYSPVLWTIDSNRIAYGPYMFESYIHHGYLRLLTGSCLGKLRLYLRICLCIHKS